MTSFGAGEFVLPHGIHVDPEGNVWVTDSMGNEAGTKGHQVIKFSPEGEILLRLGQAGVPDANGNVYGAEGPNSRAAAGGGLTKYLR